MNFEIIASGFVATIAGGLVLALLFFWAREKIFPLPRVMGIWYFEVNTISSAYNPYKGMVLRYTAILWREGNRIQGTIEKTFEDSSTGKRDFVGERRTRGTLEGYLEKKIFSKDRLYLHVVEEGINRKSTSYHDITIISDKIMNGNFSSTVADKYGEVKWQRIRF